MTGLHGPLYIVRDENPDGDTEEYYHVSLTPAPICDGDSDKCAAATCIHVRRATQHAQTA